MGDVTPNLKLNVPVFDQDPWDQDVNTNWQILDATVGLYTAIPNLTGVWKNETNYTYGQSAIDPADSSIWSCAQAHTSSIAPMTFQQERVSYPARWAMTNPGAMFYASQAANSAAAAANSAAAAAASAAAVGVALPITGGTMTGPLILAADPTDVLGAATKQYVDARVGGTGFLPLTGGTLSGHLVVGGNGVAYGNIASANRHFISFGWDGQLYAVMDGTNVGYVATQSYVNTGYLPLGGGNLSGTLTVAGELQTAAILRLNNSGSYLYGTASVVDWQMDAAGWRLRYDRGSGILYYLRGDGADLFHIDGGGNITIPSNITAPGNGVFGNVYAHNGSVFFGAGNRSVMQSDNGTYTRLGMLDNYGWFLDWSSGTVGWERYDGAQITTIDTQGNLHIIGSFQAGGGMACNGGDFWLGVSGGSRYINIASSWQFVWNGSNGDLIWTTPSGWFWEMAISVGKCVNVLGPVGGQGPYENYSDIRGKTDVVPSPYGLDAVLQLKPIEFTRIINGKREIGFSAQDVESVIPHAVREFGIDASDPDAAGSITKHSLSLTIDPIVAAVVSGMQELAARIVTLENKQ